MAKESGRRVYRNTATGGVRRSTARLGYPYVEMTDDEADAANIGGVNGPDAKGDAPDAAGGAQGAQDVAKGAKAKK